MIFLEPMKEPFSKESLSFHERIINSDINFNQVSLDQEVLSEQEIIKYI